MTSNFTTELGSVSYSLAYLAVTKYIALATSLTLKVQIWKKETEDANFNNAYLNLLAWSGEETDSMKIPFYRSDYLPCLFIMHNH